MKIGINAFLSSFPVSFEPANVDVNIIETVTKIIKGSKGQEYVVTLGLKKSCTCPGFTFRHTCKHIMETV